MKALILRWYSIPLLLIIWQVSVSTRLLNSRLLPGLGDVGTALASELADGQLIYHAGITISRALLGFALAAIVGVPVAALMARSTPFRNLFEPIFLFGYPVPKIALFPVFTYIFGLGTGSKIAFTFLECLFPIVISSQHGFRAIPRQLMWAARNMGADRRTVLLRVLLPAALPGIFAGLRIALPISIVVVVLTEMIGDSVGLGYYVTIWSTRFNFSNVYAAIMVIATVGLILDQLLLRARRAALPWEPGH